MAADRSRDQPPLQLQREGDIAARPTTTSAREFKHARNDHRCDARACLVPLRAAAHGRATDDRRRRRQWTGARPTAQAARKGARDEERKMGPNARATA
eukprot:10703607-Alexandrium_andersonii.AAC.1